MKTGISYDEAYTAAATVVAIPGTSEHNLGLAVDICAEDYQVLDDAQADTPEQQWLMEHCADYGFILRYPQGKEDQTGIIWEPWHYRYVGVEAAQEITSSGLCLEEYLALHYDFS
jgi:D-alanyl-D-alanine carboxypeptidase